VAELYLDQRPYFGLLCDSAPLFLVLGNHEAEWGWELDGTPENVPVWSTKARKLYYPNPFPDGFYSGSSKKEDFVGLRENYYAWEWGDALFIALDPYWYTKKYAGGTRPTWSNKTAGRDMWDRTIAMNSISG